MPWCILRYCTNNSRNTAKWKGITFHRFLKVGHENRNEWIRFVRKNRKEKNWLPSGHTYICSLHFSEEDKYKTGTGRVYLKKNALPHEGAPCFNPEPPRISEPILGSGSDSDSMISRTLKIELEEEATKDTAILGLPAATSDPESSLESESDSEYIIDPKENQALKQQLLKEKLWRKDRSKRIKELQRQNRNLRMKCEKYKTTITALREKLKARHSEPSEVGVGVVAVSQGTVQDAELSCDKDGKAQNS